MVKDLVDLRSEPTAEIIHDLQSLVDQALLGGKANPADPSEEMISDSDDEDAPRAPGASRKRKATSNIHRGSKHPKTELSCQGDQDPLFGMSYSVRAHAPWYKPNSVPPVTFAYTFPSSHICSRLRSLQRPVLQLQALFNPWLQGLQRTTLASLRGGRSQPALVVGVPGVPLFYKHLCFGPSDNLTGLELESPHYQPYIPEDLQAMIACFSKQKTNPGVQGLWVSANIVFEPESEQSDRVNLSLTLTTYVSPSFFGLVPLIESAKPLSVITRGPALAVLCPRPQRARLQRLAQRVSQDSHFEGQITPEWFYSIIDPAPSPDAYQDPKGKGKQKDSDFIVKPRGLKPTLLPFQSRSVHWLLSREGVQVEVDDAPQAGPSSSPHSNHRVLPMTEEQRERVTTLPYWDHVAFTGELLNVPGPHPPLDFLRYNIKSPQQPSTQERWSRTGFSVWIDYVSGVSMGHRPLANDQGGGFGVLCEEMGLGKTVEILALILLNPEPERSRMPPYYVPAVDLEVRPSGLTLIVCPLAILRQWNSEMKKHAPGLRVLIYEGINHANFKASNLDAKKVVETFDIVLCSFEVLGNEVDYARKGPDRSLRGPKKYAKRRSILVEIDFLRVCMDEVQMAAAPASTISETAALVRRKHSFAVSGTPIRSKLSDLAGLFKFLGFGLGDDAKNFGMLLTPRYADIFADVFHRIAIRTVKANVEHELVLPGQDRFIVPLTFGPIEQASYNNRYSDALVDLGLERDGSAPSMYWEPQRQTMASWIVRLRQLCCHIYSGPQGTAGASRKENGNKLMTLDQVLDDLRSDVETTLGTAVRSRFEKKIKKAHFLARDKENCEGLEEGIALLKVCLSELVPEVDRVREVLANLRKEINGSKTSNDMESDEGSDIDSVIESDDSDSDESTGHYSAKAAKRARFIAYRQHLRGLLISLHMAHFWLGSIYFVMGTMPTEENQAYENAETIRKEILRGERRRAEDAIKNLKKKTSPDRITFQREHFDLQPSEASRGIQSALILDRLDETTDKLNAIAELLWKWRRDLIDMMCSTLTADEADEEDYAKRASQEEKIDIMLDIYRQLMFVRVLKESDYKKEHATEFLDFLRADWRETFTGERDASADDASSQIVASIQMALREIATEGKIEGPRKTTKSKRKKGASSLATDIERLRDYGLGPGALFYKGLSDERHGIVDKETVSLRQIGRDVRDLLDTNIRSEEIQTLKKESSRIRTALGDLDRTYDKVSGELTGLIQPTFKSRNRFYKSLQAISDTVVDVEIKKNSNFLIEIKVIDEEEERLNKEIRTALSRQRYLEFLGNDLAGVPASERTCTICRDVFSQGVFTICGHLFCSACLRAWLSSNTSCPICKTHLKRRGAYQKVVFDENLLKKSKKSRDGPVTVTQTIKAEDVDYEAEQPRSTILNKLDQASLARIEDTEAHTGLGKKLDTVIKHVRLLQSDDPGCKIVLSAWQQALNSCAVALGRFGIKTVRLERSGKKKGEAATAFANDPSISVFLLHTHSQAAGLNLTAARYVILFEPLVHPGVELQAVGRVHRIGQEKSTSVFQYTISHTVDARLAQFNAEHGHRLFSSPGRVAAGAEEPHDAVAGSAPPTLAAKKNSEEILTTSDEDMARILFEDQELRTIQECLLQRSAQETTEQGQVE